MVLNNAAVLAAEGFIFQLDKQTLIAAGIQLLNVLILAVVLGLLLYKPVRQFMEKRTSRIQNQFAEAQGKLQEAEKLKAEYKKKLMEIEAEHDKIIETAKATAHEKARHILEEARAEAADIRKRTEESIALEKERLMKEVKYQIIDVSSAMAARFIEKSMDEETQSKLYDEIIAQLEEAQWLS